MQFVRTHEPGKPAKSRRHFRSAATGLSQCCARLKLLFSGNLSKHVVSCASIRFFPHSDAINLVSPRTLSIL